MNKITQIIILLIVPFLSYSQNFEKLPHNPDLNIVRNFEKFDIGNLCYYSNYAQDGIIGSKCRRISVHIDSVIKSKNDSLTYIVFGKSKVRENICSFTGAIKFNFANRDTTYIEIPEEDNTMGIIHGEYIFTENPEQMKTGFFSGEITIRWTMSEEGKLELAQGWYTTLDYSFAYNGYWQSYTSDNSLKCCWSDYYIPCAPPDLNASDGPDFIPNEKYDNVGWGSLRKSYLYPSDSEEVKKAREQEKKENNWWKQK